MDFTDNKNEQQEYESILPLVNIVFLLLIFFMLAGAFKTPELFNINSPISSYNNKSNDRVNVILVNKDGKIAYQDQEVSLKKLAYQLLLIKKIHGEQLSMKIKADANSPTEKIISLIETIHSVGIGQLEILTIEK